MREALEFILGSIAIASSIERRLEVRNQVLCLRTFSGRTCASWYLCHRGPIQQDGSLGSRSRHHRCIRNSTSICLHNFPTPWLARGDIFRSEPSLHLSLVAHSLQARKHEAVDVNSWASRDGRAT